MVQQFLGVAAVAVRPEHNETQESPFAPMAPMTATEVNAIRDFAQGTSSAITLKRFNSMSAARCP